MEPWRLWEPHQSHSREWTLQDIQWTPECIGAEGGRPCEQRPGREPGLQRCVGTENSPSNHSKKQELAQRVHLMFLLHRNMWALNCLLNTKHFNIEKKPSLQGDKLILSQPHYTVRSAGLEVGEVAEVILACGTHPSCTSFVSIVLLDSHRDLISQLSSECFKKRPTLFHSEGQTALSWLCTPRSREQEQALPISSSCSLVYMAFKRGPWKAFTAICDSDEE